MSDPGPTLQDIYAARRRLKPFLHETPLRDSSWLSSLTHATVQLKIESLQLTHSFKIRGAMNACLRLIEGAGASTTIVTASAGNHGRAVAYAAELLGLRAIVFTPATAPETKKAAIRQHGAELHDEPADYDAAERRAREYALVRGVPYISPYNHRDVIAGAGTIALEILDREPSLEVLVVPVGGGGLISGIGLALKNAAPRVAVVGVEAAVSRPFAIGIERGEITEIEAGTSLADGLTGNLEPGSITFNLVRRYVDQLVSVSERDLEQSIRGLAAEEHVVAEGAGATATAAVIAGKAVKPGQRAVVLLTGSNIDLGKFAGLIA